MKDICNHSLCTACGACAAICPNNCITFNSCKKENGHTYPNINQELCIDCGLCKRTCPVNNPIKLNRPAKTLAAYARDESICNTSSSGGLAYSLGQAIIRRGGVVYGCTIAYGANFRICHKRIDNLSDLAETQGSKYVHSVIDSSVYISVKKDLSEGREVLFTGTGCQIAGVRSFIKHDYSNFYAIDIICHGVPSLQLLTDYLSLRYNVPQINKLSFRDKSGFNICGSYSVNNKRIDMPLYRNLYMMGFLKGLYYRSACYNCHYAKSERGGDITLGDFWGLKAKFENRSQSSNGTSVVLVNSEKGELLLKLILKDLAMIERPLSEATDGNPQLRHPSNKHFAYSVFRLCYPIIGFKSAAAICLIREKIFYSLVLPLLNKRH